MKLSLIAVASLFLLLSIPAAAQLKDSKWIATFNIPSEVSCYMEFKKDTLNMIEVGNDVLLEQMAYTLKSDTLILHKLSGGSPCENDAKGIYRWKIDNTTLKWILISDDCEGRSAAGFDGAEMQKVIAPAAIKKE